MSLTGITADGHFVIDDLTDDVGRTVIDASAHLLSDGTRYFDITAPTGRTITGISIDGHFVFDDVIDDSGRQVTDPSHYLLGDGTPYAPISGAAPGTFSQSFQDAATLTESLDVAVQVAKTDTGVFTEAFSKRVARAVAENLGITESLEGDFTMQDIADFFRLTEHLDVQHMRWLQEGLTPTENLQAVKTKVLSLSDDLTLTETMNVDTQLKAMGDSLFLTESQIRQIAKRLTDAVAFNEALKRAAGSNRADTVAFGENFSQILTKIQSAADTVLLGENLFVQRRASVTLQDAVSLSESVAKLRAKLMAETLGITEQEAATQFVATQESLSAIEDFITEKFPGGQNAADFVLLTEAQIKEIGKQTLEDLGITETLQALVVKLLGFTEAISLTDALGVEIISGQLSRLPYVEFDLFLIPEIDFDVYVGTEVEL